MQLSAFDTRGDFVNAMLCAGMAARLARHQRAVEIIDEMVRRIVDRFQPEKIILFGSYARGTAGPDSDVDLLVVMPVAGSKRDMAAEIYSFVTPIGLPKDIIVVTPEDVEKYRGIPGTIVRPALLEGTVVYERRA